MKRVVVALGGNAIQAKKATAEAQIEALRQTSSHLISLIEKKIEVIITHGNGPQVGNLLLQQKVCDSELTPAMPIDSCVAMTEGMIGYWLQNAMGNELVKHHLKNKIVTVITKVRVDEEDPAFSNPTKPIGPFYSKEEADRLAKLNPDYIFKSDAGRGFRRVVASPKPLDILEASTIQALVEHGDIVIAVGGGGVPVIKRGNHYYGREAVIDKDYASAKLAELVKADTLLILTAVENVYINFNKPNQKKLERVTVSELFKLMQEGHFAQGSMYPKVDAAYTFVKNNKGSKAIITSLYKVDDALMGKTGTLITYR